MFRNHSAGAQKGSPGRGAAAHTASASGGQRELEDTDEQRLKPPKSSTRQKLRDSISGADLQRGKPKEFTSRLGQPRTQAPHPITGLTYCGDFRISCPAPPPHLQPRLSPRWVPLRGGAPSSRSVPLWEGTPPWTWHAESTPDGSPSCWVVVAQSRKRPFPLPAPAAPSVGCLSGAALPGEKQAAVSDPFLWAPDFRAAGRREVKPEALSTTVGVWCQARVGAELWT